MSTDATTVVPPPGPATRLKVLVVDDDVAMAKLACAELRKRGIECDQSTAGEAALTRVEEGEHDAVLTDLNMPGLSGIELATRLKKVRTGVPVVVMTAFGTMDRAVEALRAGVFDFITKPLDFELLALALQRAGEHHRLSREVNRLSAVVAQQSGYENLLGTSTIMKGVFTLIDRMAPTESTVLIVGESGTGKELVARAIHKRSRRAEGPFVAVNCAGLPETLLESEFFGHVRGAFTDAKSAKRGLFQQASGGTLFLDEIGDLPLSLQPKLLRALQEKSVRPVGGEDEIKVDVRIVAATNADLEGAVEDGRFRRDLFFRINVMQVDLPPLRARDQDVLLLAQNFLERFSGQSGQKVTGLSKDAARALLSYRWPGNVRELQNCMERGVALATGTELQVGDLPARLSEAKTESPQESGTLESMEEVERRHILRVFDACGGNRSLTARTLKLDRKTLQRKLESYGVAAGKGPGSGGD